MFVVFKLNTTTNVTPKENEHFTQETRIATLSVCFIIFVVGLIGNALIIWTFLRTKNLRNKQNVFVVFLSIVDLLIIGYLLPFNMYVMVVHNAIYPRDLCTVNALICHVLFTCSVQFIMYIALCRYTKICFSRKFEQIFSIKRILLYLFSTLVCGMAFGFPLLVNHEFLQYDRSLHQCIFNRYGNRIYSWIYMGFCLVLPISVTSFCYLQIYFHVKKSKLKLYQHWTNPLARKRLVAELILTRSQFAVFIAYLILYMPFGITALFGTSTTDFPMGFHAFSMYACYFNSSINSILYGALNRNMRRAYRQSIPCFKRSGRHYMNSSSYDGNVSGSNDNDQTTDTVKKFIILSE